MDLPHGKEGTDDLWEAMYTQRAIRYWQQKSVPREVLGKVIEAASKLPAAVICNRGSLLLLMTMVREKRLGMLSMIFMKVVR